MKITKIAPDTTIGSLVSDNFRTVSVFHKYGIDFCCGGGKSLQHVCESKQLDVDKVMLEIEEALSLERTEVDALHKYSLRNLVNYIELKHHKYIEENTPMIQQFLDKLVNVHGERYPELNQLRNVFNNLAKELAGHMKKEELILFPFIRSMEDKVNNGEGLPGSGFGSVQNPIAMMEHEHEHAGNDIETIQKLTNNFTPPEQACNTHRITFEKLLEFRDDLMIHIHLENNILFPRAIDFEKANQSV
ncbi:MAG: iron-sulfur cluster repair di-iron protein [Cryomorphaceae bacterium]|nr:iron-sulfur cluster repair di-iron protein [Cryomorphaceae bacterium]